MPNVWLNTAYGITVDHFASNTMRCKKLATIVSGLNTTLCQAKTGLK